MPGRLILLPRRIRLPADGVRRDSQFIKPGAAGAGPYWSSCFSMVAAHHDTAAALVTCLPAALRPLNIFVSNFTIIIRIANLLPIPEVDASPVTIGPSTLADSLPSPMLAMPQHIGFRQSFDYCFRGASHELVKCQCYSRPTGLPQDESRH